ncbi:Signal transduction histidine kinase [Ignavibacterium album JCM 16511]|uniref:histidine kinase n=1 Tax=Ignavibacterium album (strain DSM 19864 / JCM 16511 / NBRC 101810 / Mat9-16) TaxID=945713 RepID=I0AFY3_IGNAJ|nr:HAMP domain-containing sensor histidine kinase [Ignavibacterium album]AFH47890.1 Signal transduction histidine kinase [Ignavibacterium album JCM 16511]
MKLINKISRYFLISSSVIFIIIFLGIYFLLDKSLEREIDEKLSDIFYNVVNEIKQGKQVSFYPFVQVDSTNTFYDKKEFRDVQIFSGEENEPEPFRELTSFASINGKNYKIIVRSSLIEKEDIFVSILTIELSAFVLFILILFFINKTVSQKTFSDFYSTLKKIEGFSLKDNLPIALTKSDIEEFDKLNKSISFLSEKAIGEYRSLKEFSEELNHEIQTPVSVIKSKLELLMQSSDLSGNNLALLDTALKNLNKLERINKSILLLNKLEHKDLFESAEINLSKEIKAVVDDYNDFISSKNLKVNLKVDEKFVVSANHSLINILLSNLISNAIKHNIDNGTINIELKNNELIISNTGNFSNADPNKFFERFYKGSSSSDSVGLGLTIVKKICDLYEFVLSSNLLFENFVLSIKFDIKKLDVINSSENLQI